MQPTKRGLVFLAHGSRRNESNREIKNIFLKIKKIINKDYTAFQVAYLELANPNLSQAIDRLIRKKLVNQVIVFPYFLAAGNHITRDIPEELEIKKKEYPKIKIILLDYFGKAPHLNSFIANTLKNKSK